MNNWGLLRFAGKPFCLTGVVLCYGGYLGEKILPMYEKMACVVVLAFKIRTALNLQASYKNKKIRLRESRARMRPNYSFFIIHYSFSSRECLCLYKMYVAIHSTVDRRTVRTVSLCCSILALQYMEFQCVATFWEKFFTNSVAIPARFEF